MVESIEMDRCEKLKFFEGKSTLLILAVATSAVESKDECLNGIVGLGLHSKYITETSSTC